MSGPPNGPPKGGPNGYIGPGTKNEVNENKIRYSKENLLNDTVKGTGIGGTKGPTGGMIGGGSIGGLEICGAKN
jgi:hypothetical protein